MNRKSRSSPAISELPNLLPQRLFPDGGAAGSFQQMELQWSHSDCLPWQLHHTREQLEQALLDLAAARSDAGLRDYQAHFSKTNQLNVLCTSGLLRFLRSDRSGHVPCAGDESNDEERWDGETENCATEQRSREESWIPRIRSSRGGTEHRLLLCAAELSHVVPCLHRSKHGDNARWMNSPTTFKCW
eukprot:272682-Rhodomonas_salina.1